MSIEQPSINDIFRNPERIDPDYTGDDARPPASPEEEPIEAACAQFPLNDYGNGLRFMSHFGEDCLFVPRVGWHRWTGQVWRLDEDRIEVRRLAHKIGARIVEEVPYVALEDWERDAIEEAATARREIARLTEKDDLTPKEKKKIQDLKEVVSLGDDAKKALSSRRRSHRSHAKSSGNTASINNMLTEAASGLAVPLGHLNSDPLVVNTPSGLIRFSARTDEHDAAWARADHPAPKVWGFDLAPHAREQMVSKMISAAYDPEATAPLFAAFLERIQPDPEIRAFLKRWFGYSMTGLTTEQKLVFAWGDGRNGKSTLVDLVAEILADYATTVPIESLTGAEQRKGADATPDLVRIPGARMVRASEPDQDQRMKEAIVKALTGGEPILIRRMMQEFVEVTPEFKLTIQGNHKPTIRGDDEGIWRRVLLVPFAEQIPESEVDPLLPKKLRAEASGVLNWMIEGAVEWLSGGLAVPENIRAATDDYRAYSDPLRVFLITECEVTGRPTDRLFARDLVQAFQLWMEDNGNEPWGKRATSNRFVTAAGRFRHPETGAVFSRLKASDSFYSGIGLKPSSAIRLSERRGDDWRP